MLEIGKIYDRLSNKYVLSHSVISKDRVLFQPLLFIDRNTAVYFDSFGTEYIPQEVLSKIRNKSITHNIFRI